jgi:hypothetical protein
MKKAAMKNSTMAGSLSGYAPPTGALMAVEQVKAATEVQAALVTAQARPRDRQRVVDRILADCARLPFAEEATFEIPRGKLLVTGPSIRLAEAIAKRWGNMEAGVKELTRENGYSEAISYAWDYESNYRDVRTFTVAHWRDRRGGGYAVNDERQIYEMVANAGARRKRACILAVVDGDIVDAALKACEATLLGNVVVNQESISHMLERFAEFNVTPEQIRARLQWPIDALTPKMFLSLRRIFNSLADGMCAPSEWFDVSADTRAANVAGRSSGAKASKQPKPKPKPKPKPEPAAEPEHTFVGLTAADVRDALKHALTRVALDEAADLIRSLADEAERDELEQFYNVRVMDFDEGE